MFINPQLAIEQQWVKFPEWMTPEQQTKCIQPNALDFTIDRVAELTNTPCRIGEDKSEIIHRKQISFFPEAGWWKLHEGSYDFMSDFYVDLPVGVAALVIIRSTFNRNGLFVTTGLWDSGFKGHIAGVLHNRVGRIEVQQHVRVGQVAFVSSDKTDVMYAGGYNTQQGTHWAAK